MGRRWLRHGRQSATDEGLCFHQVAAQMICSTEGFRINLEIFFIPDGRATPNADLDLTLRTLNLTRK